MTTHGRIVWLFTRAGAALPFLTMALADWPIGPAAAQSVPAPPAACDQACLVGVMSDFVTATTTGKPTSVALGREAEVRENAKLVALDATAWNQVKAVRSIMTFADAVTGNVVSRAGVDLVDGKPGYISTRLKVVSGGRVTDVEISADTSPRVVSSYVWNLDAVYSTVLPGEQRMTRIALEALARRYFHSLSSHQAVAADFDAGCNRFHSGQQITNAGGNTVEGGPPRTCAASLEGNPPWGPATDQRFPVIDPERGIVFGVALLHYLNRPTPSQMYVSEVFKVIGGRIVRIDNIGVMMPGVATLGFVH
jgi:hypothetical protein